MTNPNIPDDQTYAPYVQPPESPYPASSSQELPPVGVLTPKIVEHQASGKDITTDERSLTGSQTTAARSVLVDDSSKPSIAEPAISDALVTSTLAVLGRRGAVAEREVREILEASLGGALLAEGAGTDVATNDMRFAHERVAQPDGSHAYFTAGGERIDPKNVVLPTGALAPQSGVPASSLVPLDDAGPPDSAGNKI
jgi:hypothetical protein